MAANDLEVKVKPHSHPGILAVSLLALAVSGVSLGLQACPPVPVPAAAPAKVDPVPAPESAVSPVPVAAPAVMPAAPPVAAEVKPDASAAHVVAATVAEGSKSL